MSIARKIISLCMALISCMSAIGASNDGVEKVYVLFKTHLDVGFTDLSSVVTKRYLDDFIPRAIEVNDALRADGSGDRYVWTTGSWLVWKYLHTMPEPACEKLDEAIRRGDIAWNAVPYTVESETMNRDLLHTMLLVSHRLDEKYGKHTIGAKMTDVPGHTRSIIPEFAKVGIKYLHVGVNPASPIPAVPEICRWRDAASGEEIILQYQQDYGAESILPGGKTALSINFTGDNHGPHTYEQVKAIYASLRERYPNAELVPATFSDVAAELDKIKDSLPVVTSEIGDTWIYGYGSAPLRMAKFRKLQSLYSQWLRDGKISIDSDEAINFAVELGLIAEHTQGMDIKTHLRNWDKYDMDKFLAARSSEPFKKVEKSWREIDDYVYSAIAFLPENLRNEAYAEMQRIETPVAVKQKSIATLFSKNKDKEWSQPVLGGLLNVSGVTYQTFDADDADDYLNRYLRARYDWALDDIGKTGLKESGAVSATVKAKIEKQYSKKEKEGTRIISEIAFPAESGVDNRALPEKMQVECFLYKGDSKADITLTIFNKPAVRLPESYWISFDAPSIVGIVAEKIGEEVDLTDVVEKGNRRMHGIDRYADIVTADGKLRIWSDEAFLVNVGEAKGWDYSTDKPDCTGGLHFNLSNNLWGTNFAMWNEGSITYHFTIEKQ